MSLHYNIRFSFNCINVLCMYEYINLTCSIILTILHTLYDNYFYSEISSKQHTEVTFIVCLTKVIYIIKNIFFKSVKSFNHQGITRRIEFFKIIRSN